MNKKWSSKSIAGSILFEEEVTAEDLSRIVISLRCGSLMDDFDFHIRKGFYRGEYFLSFLYVLKSEDDDSFDLFTERVIDIIKQELGVVSHNDKGKFPRGVKGFMCQALYAPGSRF